MALSIEKKFAVDLDKPLNVQYGGGLMFTGDAGADTFEITLNKSGEAYAPGGSVALNCIRADGNTVTVAGNMSGNIATATLTQACCAIPGPLSVVMQIISGGNTGAVFAAAYTVMPAQTGEPIDPGTTITDIAALIAQIDAAVDSIPADYSDLLAAIAPTFSTSTAYAAGDYVWYDGELYKFIAAHSAGAWIGSDVAAAVFATEISELKSALPINKAEVFGGSIAPIFELGTVYFDNNWQYINSNKRIRFPQGMTIRLQKGSTIALSSYENAKLNVGWKINGVISGYSGWITTTYTTQVEAEYAIAVMSYPETVQSSPDALASLVLLNGVSPFAIAENKRLYDSGNVISKENVLPGYINPAGWHIFTPTAAQERVTGFIPVNPGDKWTAYSRSSSNFRISFACYSEAKDGNTKFLTPRHDYETYETDGAYKYNFVTFTIPEGCYFIRVYFATDGLENYYLYNTTTKDPNGLLALKGYYQLDGIRADISDAEKNIFNTDKEINIQGYTPTAYNLESGKWASSAVYRCILVPVSDLAFSIRFVADTYKCSYAFLRSNTITVGEVPDLCGGEKVTTLSTGNEKIVKVPDDCEYLYVYITDGTRFGNYHVINRALRKDFNPVRNNAKGVAYISDVDQILRTIKHRHDGNANTFSGTNWSDNLLVLAQITDVHSDPTSYARFISFLNENTDTINAGIVSGDLVDHGADSQFTLMIGCESELSENATLIKCLGNHEIQSNKTQAETYTAYGLDTNTGKSYYYVDYATQKIRIICLDQYDTDDSDVNKRTKTAHYSQTQIDWFINTLKNATTNGYAVIVVYHSCNEVGFPTYNDSGFCQDRQYAMFPSPTSGTIISDIIDAFQNATALDETYTASDISVTLTVDTSFTTKGTFICYICGHEHIDYVGYSSKYPRQLICIAQGGVVLSESRGEAEAHWQSMYDTPRVANTSTHDSFNVYGFDTVNRLVKIAKIGSTLTDKFVPRSFATFRY